MLGFPPLDGPLKPRFNLIKNVRLALPVQFLVLCGPAYRPTEEIDLRSIGWGNIFQLPFKHLRDYRLRLLCPFFVYSGFEVVFAISGFAVVRKPPCIGHIAEGKL